jgi:hypothetical protein
MPPNDPASPSASCTPTRGPTLDNYLQTQVQRFFETDFLTPVIASAFVFDAPSLFIPQLRFGQDRAVGVGNLLDFRPDIQVATSTAVVLSARFPLITPPAAIAENSRIIKSRGLFNKTKARAHRWRVL